MEESNSKSGLVMTSEMKRLLEVADHIEKESEYKPYISEGLVIVPDFVDEVAYKKPVYIAGITGSPRIHFCVYGPEGIIERKFGSKDSGWAAKFTIPVTLTITEEKKKPYTKNKKWFHQFDRKKY